jgi:GTP-binding protein Era
MRAGRVAIVGRPNVGKSTLLNALIGEPIAITSRHPQTTRDRIAGVLTLPSKSGSTNDSAEGAQFVFLDTPGLHRARNKLGHRMNALARDAVAGADVVIFVTEPPAGSQAGVRDVDRALLAEVEGRPVILALNKIDRVKTKATLLPVLEAHVKAFSFRAVVPISARTGDGAERLLAETRALLPEGGLMFEKDALSDKPVRFFVAELVREQILKRTRDEVPHGVAVSVERFDESARVPRIDLVVHVDKESHKKILIGKKGAMLKEIGKGARERVERLMGRQVYLQMFVRVTPAWYASDAGLAAVGYEETP